MKGFQSFIDSVQNQWGFTKRLRDWCFFPFEMVNCAEKAHHGNRNKILVVDSFQATLQIDGSNKKLWQTRFQHRQAKDLLLVVSRLRREEEVVHLIEALFPRSWA